MTPRWSAWAGALVLSLVAHGGLLAGLAVAIQPDPVQQQPLPESELDVQPHVLERHTARETEARGAPARQDAATGAPVASGAVSSSRANRVAPVASPVKGAAPPAVAAVAGQPDADVAGAVVPPSAALAEAVPVAEAAQVTEARAETAATAVAAAAAPVTTAEPEAQTAGAVTMVADPLPSAPAPLRQAPAATVDAVTLAAFAAPTAEAQPSAPMALPTPAAAPPLAAWRAGQPDSRPAPPREPEAATAPEASAQPSRIKAALAFAGDGAGDVDPVSLAAFQSFMRPGDASGAGDPLRDGVAAVLAQVPCARLQVSFDPEATILRVNGHVPEDGLRAPVLAALRAQMGADIAVSDNMLILPRPQCGALSGIANAGLPQSTDQITNPLLIGADTHARMFRFSEGSLLTLDMTAPDYDAYIYLDYFDAAGNVLHLEPNEFAPLRHAKAKEAQRIGARSLQDEGLKLVVGPPFGQEIAVAFASSVPLYDGLRPMVEPAGPYLDWLRERVADARRRAPDFKGEWVYFFVATSAK